MSKTAAIVPVLGHRRASVAVWLRRATARGPLHRRTRAALIAIGAFLLLPAGVAWALGELSQKPGTAGCVSETGTGGACQNGRALQAAFGVVASPDGKSLYVASSSSDAVAVFDRDPVSGALTQKGGTAACVSEDGTGGLCQNGTALDGASGAAVSPDGKSVYVASEDSGAAAIFDRDPATGALSQKPGTAGCVSDDGMGGLCQNGAALDFANNLSVSPDGKSVYAVSRVSHAVAVFDRNPATGALSQKPGSAGCVSEDGTGGLCQNGTALLNPFGVTVSPDGKSLYTASQDSDAVAIFDRDPATGAVTQKPGAAGCVSEDGTGGVCQDGTALDGAVGVAASPDGQSVYSASGFSGAVAIFDRDPNTGALTQKPGTAGCISDDGSGGFCENGTALDGAVGVAASPDGQSVYSASGFSDAVAIFDREPNTGALTQKPGAACISETGTGACEDGTALDFAAGVAASPDGKSVYVTSLFSHAVSVFDRATPSSPSTPPLPPSTPLAPPPPDTLGPTVAGFALAPERFRVARAATQTDARAAQRRRPARRGSRLRFTLSEPAGVRIVIERARPGRRVGRRCKAPTRRLRQRRRCTRYARAGTLTRRNLPTGRSTIAFSGRIGRRALAPGAYRATITATDPAGNRSKAKRATFTIVSR